MNAPRRRRGVGGLATTVSVTVALGCAARPEVQQPTPVDAHVEDARKEPAPSETFVVVWADASWRRSLDDSAPIRSHRFDSGGRGEHPGAWFVTRVLDTDGPWRRVATTSMSEGAAPHCVSAELVSEAELFLWVHERDLVPVLVEPLAVEHADGSRASLRPGTPVLDGYAWASGVGIPLEVAGNVGHDYVPSVVHDREIDATTLEPASRPSVGVRFGGVDVDWALYSGPVEERWWRRVGGTPRFVQSTRCGTVELVGAEAVRAETVPRELAVFGERFDDVPAGMVGPGEPMLWPDGTEAGAATAYLVHPELSTDGGAGLACVDIHVGRQLRGPGHRDEVASVCVNASAVVATTTFRGPW